MPAVPDSEGGLHARDRLFPLLYEVFAVVVQLPGLQQYSNKHRKTPVARCAAKQLTLEFTCMGDTWELCTYRLRTELGTSSAVLLLFRADALDKRETAEESREM